MDDDRFVKPLWCRLATGRSGGLAGQAPGAPVAEAPLTRFCTSREIVDDIRRNIEVILNSRVPILSSYFLSAAHPLLDRSVVNFGIIDFNSITVDDQDQENRFCKSVVHAIQGSEPRVSEVHVTLLKSMEERFVALDIAATLNVHPYESLPIKFGFDSEVQKFVAE